jgi:uncharacterized protein
MKRSTRIYQFLPLIFVLSLTGCISIPNSKNPSFYNINPLDETQVGIKLRIPTDPVVLISTAKIPDYLDRPQMVTMDKEGSLDFAQFQRWAEPLDKGLSRVIEENLSLIIPSSKFSAYPWNLDIPVKYRIDLELLDLKADLKNNLEFTVRWMIIDVAENKILILKRSSISQHIDGGSYSAMAKSLSSSCAALSKEIAQALATL